MKDGLYACKLGDSGNADSRIPVDWERKGGCPVRIAICDDSAADREQFASALHIWDSTQRAEGYADGASLLAAAREPDRFDIVFLDVYMPGENGVDIARALQSVSPGTGIVFITTSQEHAVDAFSLHALHYLLKPVTAEGVTEAFHRLAQLPQRHRPMIVLPIGHDSLNVYLDEICYIQSVKHVKEIALTNGRLIKVWMPMTELESRLSPNFLKISRGTIVNMEKIERMSVDTCTLRDGTQLYMTRRKHAALRAAYDDYLFSRLSENARFDAEG